MQLLLMKDFTDNQMMTKLQFIFKRTQNGLASMMAMEGLNVPSSLKKNFMNIFSTVTGEKMCRLH